MLDHLGLTTRPGLGRGAMLGACTLLAIALVAAAPGAGARPKPAAKAAKTAKTAPVDVPPQLDPVEAVRRAHTLRDEGHAGEAEPLLRTVVEQAPDNLPALVELAETLTDLDRDDDAMHLYERIVAMQPDDATTRMRLADFYLFKDQPDAALGHYMVVLNARPNDPSLHQKVAQILMAMDRTADAVPHLKAYCDAVPGDVDARKELYKAYLWTDDVASAMAMLRQIVAEHPEDLDSTRELAERMVDKSDEKGAIELYERLVERNPTDSPARRELGELYEWNDAPRKALDQYEAYLELKPFDSEIRGRALQLSVDLGLGNRAKSHADVLGVADPRSRELSRQMMLVETGLGTSLGAEYAFFNNNNQFFHHEVGPRFRYGIGEDIGVGARYAFHLVKGPQSYVTPAVEPPGGPATGQAMGHTGEVFADFRLPWDLLLQAGVAVTWWDTHWTSVGALLALTKDFGEASITLSGQRAEYLTTFGDLDFKVMGNTAALDVAWEFWYPMFVTLGGEYTYLQASGLPANHRLMGQVGLGVVAYDDPRVEVAYEYDIEAFTKTSPDQFSYFVRNHYQRHGPAISLRHPVLHWLLYGFDVHLWHIPEDSTSTFPTMQLTYGAELVMRPGGDNLIKLAYHRTDTIVGYSSSLYNENVLTVSYTYEF